MMGITKSLTGKAGNKGKHSMKMKILASTAGVAVALAVAAPAFAQGSGSIGASVGTVRINGNEETAYTASGGYAFDLSGDMDLEIGAGIVDFGGNNNETYGASAALVSRNANRAFGGAIAYADNDIADYWEVSGLAQLYTMGFTGTGQVFYGSVDVGTDVDVRGARLEGSFFMQDNLALNVGTSYTDVEGANGGFAFGLNTEWKANSSPLGVFAGGRYINAPGGDVTIWEIGLRGTFGAQTLRERSQEGPAPVGLLSNLAF